MTSNYSFRRLAISRQCPANSSPGYDSLTAVATSQQAAIADALTAIGTTWQAGLSNVTTGRHGHIYDQLDIERSISSDYYQPYTVASCESDVIQGLDDHRAVAFPPPPGSTAQMLNTSAFNDSIISDDVDFSTHAFVFPGITRSQILNTPGPPEETRLRWVQLPQDPFNGTVLLPRSSENTTQSILTCNIGAGWGSSTLNISTLSGSTGIVLSQVNPGQMPSTPIPHNVSKAESLIVGNIGGYFLLP